MVATTYTGHPPTDAPPREGRDRTRHGRRISPHVSLTKVCSVDSKGIFSRFLAVPEVRCGQLEKSLPPAPTCCVWLRSTCNERLNLGSCCRESHLQTVDLVSQGRYGTRPAWVMRGATGRTAGPRTLPQEQLLGPETLRPQSRSEVPPRQKVLWASWLTKFSGDQFHGGWFPAFLAPNVWQPCP